MEDAAIASRIASGVFWLLSCSSAPPSTAYPISSTHCPDEHRQDAELTQRRRHRAQDPAAPSPIGFRWACKGIIRGHNERDWEAAHLLGKDAG
ncbi:hypothetical protein BJ912DRAFT_618176 [Pholiota molesta]|nr:hypothetical protein BJ912DRAFT_618176 [Pholiota molesta]